MSKARIPLDIPGFGLRHISKLLTDYTGTLSMRRSADGGSQREP